MLMFVDELNRELDDLMEIASLIDQKFEAERDAAELLIDARFLYKRIENLKQMMPEGTSIGSGLRHAGWMIHWLERSDKRSCRQDITDILSTDLPAARNSLKKWANELTYLDVGLREELSPLIRFKEFDSAIRKAFVVLKDRICEKFELDKIEDGQKLVNKLFSPDGPAIDGIENQSRQAYRDLYAGMFGLMRNRYAHNNVQATLTELDAVISAVNLCLHLIGDFRSKEKLPF
jgi:Protein of unknown function (Hypoth_ymh)